MIYKFILAYMHGVHKSYLESKLSMLVRIQLLPLYYLFGINMKKKKTKFVRFNPVAIHQHINKGGRHGKTEKAIRNQDKLNLSKLIKSDVDINS